VSHSAAALAAQAEFAPFTIPAKGSEMHQPETSISPRTHHDPAAVLEVTQLRPECDPEQSTHETCFVADLNKTREGPMLSRHNPSAAPMALELATSAYRKLIRVSVWLISSAHRSARNRNVYTGMSTAGEN
jgi:hypothetical protein